MHPSHREPGRWGLGEDNGENGDDGEDGTAGKVEMCGMQMRRTTEQYAQRTTARCAVWYNRAQEAQRSEKKEAS
ncbi:hypothetical protein V490_04017 [Pseudogymnoascus sp. VKM F-3557]|nr:hypothetical protein V490_04017 [Pseudogymnoascus sp. VKM F-3557]